MIDIFYPLKSRCDDGDYCSLYWWQVSGLLVIKFGEEVCVFNEIPSDEDFLHQLRSHDRRNKLTADLETELLDQLRYLRTPCDRAEIQEVIGYDS